MKTTITQVGTKGAGKASRIALQAFNENEALTAVRSGSGNLLLIGWDTRNSIERRADSNTQAGAVHEIALNVLGRRAVTSVRTGDGRLLLISWEVPDGLGSITRLKDSNTLAGEASLIEATVTLDPSTLVTAVRAANGKLKLISWRLEADGSFSRLGDSADQAGEVGLIAVSALLSFPGSPSTIVVTAVRTARGTLKMIGWNVPAQGPIVRFERDREFEAGAIGEIAMARRRDFDGPVSPSGVITAVRTGSGNLLVSLWRAGEGGFTRVADVTAGEARAIAIEAAGPSPSTYVASMRNGSGDLQLIAFEVGSNDSLTRTGEHVRVGAKVTETAIVGLAGARALTATRTRESLSVSSWSFQEVPTSLHADAANELPDVSLHGESR
jgi:hypothetical protein